MATKVYLSQENYENSRIVIWIFRIMGLFPITIKSKELWCILKISPWYTLYSYIFGLYIIVASYYNQLYENFSQSNKSLHVTTKTDGIVRFLLFSTTCKLIFFAVFVMPWKLHQFYGYIKCIGEVDSVINTRYTKLEKQKPGIMLIALLIYNVAVDSIAVCLTHATTKVSVINILFWNSGYYSIFIMALVLKYINGHMEQILEKRIILLTQVLEKGCLINTNNGEVFFNVSYNKIKKESFSESIEESLGFEFGKVITINTLSNVYLKLMDAADFVNDWLGINILLAVIAMVCQLVGCKYFLILLLEGKGTEFRKISLRIGLFSVQIIRLLMIVEPWHSCSIQLETIKRGVCKLLPLNLNEKNRKQVNAFAMILCLRQFKFSAGGYFDVDRGLYTSVIGTIVTFLVISLQAKEQD